MDISLIYKIVRFIIILEQVNAFLRITIIIIAKLNTDQPDNFPTSINI